MLPNEKYKSKIGNRNSTYFFTVKESKNEQLFLHISERSKQQTGYERFNILVNEKNIDDFLDEIQKAVEFINEIKKERDGEYYIDLD